MTIKKRIRLGRVPRPRLGRGMTLIELLVSLFIIALMAGVAVPMFSSYQRRNTLDTDAQSISSIFSYARALQNNPDVFSRFPTPTGYVIKFFRSERKIKIYPENDSNYIIDQFEFGSGEELTVQTEEGEKSDDFTITFSGKSPAELMTCSPTACPNYLILLLKLSNNSEAYARKTIYLQNTNPATNQYFSVTVN